VGGELRHPFALLAMLLLAACGGGSEAMAPETETAAASGAAVALAGTTLSGEELSLEELRGKPVFVNVWASW
jgi:hypothetical protein